MATTVHVVVTQEDIDNGFSGNSSRCPIARAISRTTERPLEVGCYSILDTSGIIGDLPEEAVDFVALFDNGELVSPFEFDVILYL